MTSNTSEASGGGVSAFANLLLKSSTISSNSSRGSGGGVYAGSVTLTNGSVVSGNSTTGARAAGGGIFAIGTSVFDAEVSDNSAIGNDASGGGIYTRSIRSLNSTVSGNLVSGLNAIGGGVSLLNNANQGESTFFNSTIDLNSAVGQEARGGGLFFIGNLTVTDSTISGNTSRGNDFPNGAYGGGIAADSGDLILVNSTVSQNHADQSGGGIHMAQDGNLTLNNSTVAENIGGGVSVDGNVTITSSEVIGNTGGGISSQGFVAATDSTISNNQNYGMGGGILSSFGVELTNSIVSQNSASGGGGIYVESGSTLLTGSTISGNAVVLRDFAGMVRAVGGGIAVRAGTVTITNSVVSGNSSNGDDSFGGGLYVGNGDVTLINSDASGNTAIGETEAAGAAVFVERGPVLLINSTANSNTVISGENEGAGAIVAGGDVTLRGSDVSGNAGGGISGNVVTLNESTVSGNTSRGSGGEIASFVASLVKSVVSDNVSMSAGGGIYAFDFVELMQSTVTGNTSAGRGGGIAINGTATLTDSTVSGNTITGNQLRGGGIYSREVDLVNSTVSGNTAARNVDRILRGYGGGIYSITGGTLTNSTVTNNVAGMVGGGIRVRDGSLTLNNSIVADNIDNGSAPDIRPGFGSTLTVNHSLIGNTGIELNSAQLQAITNGPGNLQNVNPLLGPLADNGGPTQTHALLAGSPAIDAGDNSLAVNTDETPLMTDQRGTGFHRSVAEVVDIGALEADLVAATAPIITNVTRDEGGMLARPDLINTFAVTFDQDVSVSQDALAIFNNTIGTPVESMGADFLYDPINFIATWSLGSLMLQPAFYSFELSSDISTVVGGVALDGNADGTGGDGRNEEVYVAIPGDTNLDGAIDVLVDAFALVNNLGTAGRATWAQGDLNADGNVDVLLDAFTLVGNVGMSVIPPVTSELRVSATSNEPSTTAIPSPVLTATNLLPNDLAEEAPPARQPDPVEHTTPALAGSQTLDAAFASDDWLI